MQLNYKKWQKKEQTFVLYFEQNWVNKNHNWFEVIRHFTSSTNNALESFNGRIKRDFDFQGRPGLNQFKVKIMEVIHILSCEYRYKVKSFKAEPKIWRNTWIKAMKWAQSDKNCIIEKSHDNHGIYYVPGKKPDKITALNVQNYLKGGTFDIYVKNMFSVWKICVFDDKKIT